EYVHKSEALLMEAVKEAGEVFKDVVKVVPPEEVEGSSGFVWDGTDMWMLPTGRWESAEGGTKGKGRKISGTVLAQRAVATRAEALLKRLKHDPEIIGRDTEGDGDVGAQFEEWIKVNVD